jgi:hypothetical protein
MTEAFANEQTGKAYAPGMCPYANISGSRLWRLKSRGYASTRGECPTCLCLRLTAWGKGHRRPWLGKAAQEVRRRWGRQVL